MEQKLAKSFDKFNSLIHQKCTLEKPNNLVLSPLSIQACLTLALMGAKGKTVEDMNSALGYNEVTRDEIISHFADIMKSLNDDKCIEIANKMYAKQNIAYKNEFNEIATKKFNSEIENVDFTKNVEAAGKINEWVESKTNNKIKEFIKSGDILPHTQLILINAIYFKANWIQIFEKSNTEIKTFWMNDVEKLEVPMMFHKKRHSFGRFVDLDAVAIEMNYKMSEMSMIIILPNQKNGLTTLEEKLKENEMSQLIEKMESREVYVTIPKFRFSFDISLKNVLSEMGMGSMFNADADFSNILEGEKLKIDDVIHKTFIDVNEEGTEAAAVTATRLLGCCLQKEKYEFTADHPFYFCLYHRQLQKVVFSGRVILPEYN